jgi:hypothetical protein
VLRQYSDTVPIARYKQPRRGLNEVFGARC